MMSLRHAAMSPVITMPLPATARSLSLAVPTWTAPFPARARRWVRALDFLYATPAITPLLASRAFWPGRPRRRAATEAARARHASLSISNFYRFYLLSHKLRCRSRDIFVFPRFLPATTSYRHHLIDADASAPQFFLLATMPRYVAGLLAAAFDISDRARFRAGCARQYSYAPRAPCDSIEILHY